ncbi:hypothetical protein ACOMHN_041690 [Nucella lapillus]
MTIYRFAFACQVGLFSLLTRLAVAGPPSAAQPVLEVNGDSGYFLSPNHPSRYPGNQNLTYRAHLVTQGPLILQVHFNIDLESTGGTCYDYVSIYTTKYCGYGITTRQIRINETEFVMNFYSDQRVQKSGFNVSFSILEVLPRETILPTTMTSTTERQEPLASTSDVTTDDEVRSASESASVSTETRESVSEKTTFVTPPNSMHTFLTETISDRPVSSDPVSEDAPTTDSSTSNDLFRTSESSAELPSSSNNLTEAASRDEVSTNSLMADFTANHTTDRNDQETDDPETTVGPQQSTDGNSSTGRFTDVDSTTAIESRDETTLRGEEGTTTTPEILPQTVGEFSTSGKPTAETTSGESVTNHATPEDSYATSDLSHATSDVSLATSDVSYATLAVGLATSEGSNATSGVGLATSDVSHTSSEVTHATSEDVSHNTSPSQWAEAGTTLSEDISNFTSEHTQGMPTSFNNTNNITTGQPSEQTTQKELSTNSNFDQFTEQTSNDQNNIGPAISATTVPNTTTPNHNRTEMIQEHSTEVTSSNQGFSEVSSIMHNTDKTTLSLANTGQITENPVTLSPTSSDLVTGPTTGQGPITDSTDPTEEASVVTDSTTSNIIHNTSMAEGVWSNVSASGHFTVSFPSTSNSPEEQSDARSFTRQATTDATFTVTSQFKLPLSQKSCRCVLASKVTKQKYGKMADLITSLILKKDNISAIRRRYISAPDHRHSSQTIGVVGIIICCLPVLFIVFTDLVGLCTRDPTVPYGFHPDHHYIK